MSAPPLNGGSAADMVTSSKAGIRRYKVDQGSTGFYNGVEARAFKEWPTATTGTYVIKAVVPIDIILTAIELQIETGTIRMETVAGGTPGGVFAETLPVFRANNMSVAPAYTPTVVLTAGGTHTGGTLLDVLRVKADLNSNRSASVGDSQGSERGVAPGTYHFRLALNGVIGTLKMRWEDFIHG
jgi:hypothetical protein